MRVAIPAASSYKLHMVGCPNTLNPSVTSS
jgi:hypothetical protein